MTDIFDVKRTRIATTFLFQNRHTFLRSWLLRQGIVYPGIMTLFLVAEKSRNELAEENRIFPCVLGERFFRLDDLRLRQTIVLFHHRRPDALVNAVVQVKLGVALAGEDVPGGSGDEDFV
eukprot:GDKI01001752.1.p1 GENE.GDKI01001752.1~~GDKI01001752.1.p1  ORF type:complete len:120 (-),score=3.77 GDKI01001752.1:14-373(-)